MNKTAIVPIRHDGHALFREQVCTITLRDTAKGHLEVSIAFNPDVDLNDKNGSVACSLAADCIEVIKLRIDEWRQPE